MEILNPQDYLNCPICGKLCSIESGRGYDWNYISARNVKTSLCFNATREDPLHCYKHVVDTDKPDQIAYQEFSVNLGNKYVLFLNNYALNISSIKHNLHATAFQFPLLIMPDFPALKNLKNKIKIIITFS